MYRYQHKLYEKEAIYIAGPECFYTYGYDALGAMKARANALGFGVTLPNTHSLDLKIRINRKGQTAFLMIWIK